MLKGQLHSDTKFGTFLKEFALSRKDLKNFVEIGTWNGQGSTLQISSSLAERSDGSSLHSFEADGEMLRTAMENYHHSRDSLHFVHGRVSDEIMSLERLRWHHLYKGVHMEEWLEGEKKAFDTCPLVRDVVPCPLDFVLLDGGEFSTFGDWKFLKTLNPKVVAMTCTSALKSFDIFSELSKSAVWTIVGQGDEFQGWAVFENMRHSFEEIAETDPSPIPEEIAEEKEVVVEDEKDVKDSDALPETAVEKEEGACEEVEETPRLTEIPVIVAEREFVPSNAVENIEEIVDAVVQEPIAFTRKRSTKKNQDDKPKKTAAPKRTISKKTPSAKKLVIPEDAETPEISPFKEIVDDIIEGSYYREGAPSPESSGVAEN